MKLFSTLGAALAIALIGMAQEAHAQDYLKFLEPVQAWKDIEFKISGEQEFDRDFENSPNDFESSTIGLDFSTTLFADEDFGISLNMGASYRDVEDLSVLPDQFARANLGVMTTFALNDHGVRFFGSLSATTANDYEDMESEDISVETLMAVSIPLGREWVLVPGLFFSSRTLDGNTPAIPYPLIEAMYRPDDSFTLIFGIPATGFFWKANDWLSLNAFTFMLASANISVREQVNEDTSFDQFYRFSGESYRLTDENFFPDDYTVNSQSQELGIGWTYAPTWERDNGKETTLTLRLEYAAQFGYRWDFRNDDRHRLGAYTDLEASNVVRLELGVSF